MTDTEKLANRLVVQIKKGSDTKGVLEACKNILEKYGKSDLFPSVLDKILVDFKKENESETLVIDSPFELSDDTIKKIKNIVSPLDTDMDVKRNISPKLLAGFRARHKGTVYDASARQYIETLKKL